MTAWIRSEKYSTKKCPVYFHPTYEYALAKQKYSRPHWCLLKKIEHDEARGISRWECLEHFLSNITFNEAKRWRDGLKTASITQIIRRFNHEYHYQHHT